MHSRRFRFHARSHYVQCTMYNVVFGSAMADFVVRQEMDDSKAQEATGNLLQLDLLLEKHAQGIQLCCRVTLLPAINRNPFIVANQMVVLLVVCKWPARVLSQS